MRLSNPNTMRLRFPDRLGSRVQLHPRRHFSSPPHVWLFCLFLTFCCLSSSELWAQKKLVDYDKPKDYTLSGITVESSGSMDKNTVVAMSGLTIGSTISIPGQQVSDAIKKLWKQGLFSDVVVETENISGNNVFLIIRVAERPRIEKFAFNGVTKGQADDLREKISFIRGTIFTETKRMNALRVIKNFYQEKGFYHTKADITTTLNARNEVAINIDIDKGRRTKVASIQMVGNQDLSAAQLRRKLKETKQVRFFRLFKRSKYIRGNFVEDKKKMIEYLQSKGYRDARIVTDTLYPASANRLKIEMEVYEGNKYYYRNIAWTGNFKYDDTQLSTALGIKKGSVYNPVELEKRLTIDPNGTDISSLYMDDGYLFFNITPVETAVDGDSVDVELRIFEGPQANNNKIMVEGNDKTSDYVILREIRTLPGNKFSRADVIRSQREIIALGYFDQETLNPLPMPDMNRGTVDIKYKVDEKPNDQLQLQGGWGGRIRDNNGNIIGGGLLGTVSVTFNNFSSKRFFKRDAWKRGFLPSGDGQRLNLAYQTNGRAFQNFSAGFVEPWFGGKKPNSLGVNTNYSVQRYDPTQYRISILGASVDYGKRLKFPDDHFRMYWSAGYRNYDVQNGGATFGIENGNINVWSLKFTLDRTSVDAPVYPRNGSINTFSVQATPPWSSFISKDYAGLKASGNLGELYRNLEFHKWKLDNSWFLRLAGSLVGNFKMRHGFIGYYNPTIGLSQFERFYLGGDGLQMFFLDGREIIGLRGYQNNALGPRNVAGSTIGGTIFTKYTFELRQLLTPPKTQQLMVWLHGFVEAGNAWDKFRDYNPFLLKRSAGAGVRLMLPFMGLIGVDWGYGFDTVVREGDGLSKGRFHFIFGQQF